MSGPPLVRRHGRKTKVGLSATDSAPLDFERSERNNHTHVIGSTGTGKSKFLELMLRQDVADPGCGVCLIDPHGKLYNDILTHISVTNPRLAKRVVTFNPFNDLENVVGFNPLPLDKSRIDYIEKNFVTACLKAWGQHDLNETPRIARWLQNIAHTLIVNDLTLLESAPLISAAKISPMRDKMVSNVISETVRADWEDIATGAQSRRSEMVEGAGNRLNSFLQNEIIRLIIGQQKNVLDLESVLADGKILLINLNDENGRVTAPDAKLLGTMIISELYRLAKLRDVYDEKLKPFYIYIDEFAQFVSRDIALSLEETRKFKTFFVLAHQHLAQLKRDDAYLYASVLTNCKNKVIFGGLSDDDLEIMTNEVHVGDLDLLAIKHEQMRIRERHLETTRNVLNSGKSTTDTRTKSIGKSQATSTTQTHSDSKAQTAGETLTRSEQEGENRTNATSTGRTTNRSTTETQNHSTSKGSSLQETNTSGTGQSLSHDIGISEGRTVGSNSSKGGSETRTTGGNESKSKTVSQGFSEHQSHSESTSNSHTDSHSNAENWNQGSSQMTGGSQTIYGDSYDADARTRSETGSRSDSYGGSDQYGNADTRSQSYASQSGTTQSQTKANSASRGTNWSNAEGTNYSHGSNESRSFTMSERRGQTDSATQSKALGQGTNQSVTDGTTSGQSEGHSDSNSETETFGKTSSTTRSHGKQASETVGKTHSSSEGQTDTVSETDSTSHGDTISEGYSIIPFLEPHEVEELASVQFWSKDELLYIKKADMKNLGVGQAVVKISDQNPQYCRIAEVKDHPLPLRSRRNALKKITEKIAKHHPDMYVSLYDAKRQIQDRQIEAFGEPIRFYDTLTPEQDEQSSTTSSEADNMETARGSVFGG